MWGWGLCPSRESAFSPPVIISHASMCRGQTCLLCLENILCLENFWTCVCAPLCAEGASVGCASHVHVHAAWVCMPMRLCVCVFVSMYLCARPCLCVCTRVHIYPPRLMRKEICSVAPGPGDDLISPGPSCPTCWALVMAKPFQTWNAE